MYIYRFFCIFSYYNSCCRRAVYGKDLHLGKFTPQISVVFLSVDVTVGIGQHLLILLLSQELCQQ